jgi:hypothetical protein
MPSQNAFGTPSAGRASKAACDLKLPVSLRAAAEAADFDFSFLVHYAD